MSGPTEPSGPIEPTEAALASLFREEWPRLIGAALRITGDLQAAEDVAAETLVTALDRWPLTGLPDRPGAWLMTVCRNGALNVLRDNARARRAHEYMAALLPDPEAPIEAIPDDRLRLIVLCCHRLLSVDAQVALTLRMVGGLTTAEIARGFHLPPATIAQRVVRAKRQLKEHGVNFAEDDLDPSGRLPSVLDVIYLIFNEGYLATAGDSLVRGELAFEAYCLACLLTELTPAEPEPWALRALISFQLSRWATRTNANGELLTLDVQDRSKWNTQLIADGVIALERARIGGERGSLLLQAELAACHATAPAFEATDWAEIVGLYDELAAIQDTPVVSLNRVVAVAMRDGPAAGIALLNDLVSDETLRGSHRVWSIRADLHGRMGNNCAAIADYDKALLRVTNDAERRHLAAARRRLADDSQPESEQEDDHAAR
ncbi:MAG: RNA polymerase sigma factor [Streptosporangiaceae bacterium]